MDDLNDNPQKVAEDIIKQATGLGFKNEATVRIVRILETYHQLQNDLAMFKEQKETESDVSIDGSFSWKTIQGQKHGPYCAACYTKTQGKELIRLIEVKNHSGRCAKRGTFCVDSIYDELSGFDDDENW